MRENRFLTIGVIFLALLILGLSIISFIDEKLKTEQQSPLYSPIADELNIDGNTENSTGIPSYTEDEWAQIEELGNKNAEEYLAEYTPFDLSKYPPADDINPLMEQMIDYSDMNPEGNRAEVASIATLGSSVFGGDPSDVYYEYNRNNDDIMKTEYILRLGNNAAYMYFNNEHTVVYLKDCKDE